MFPNDANCDHWVPKLPELLKIAAVDPQPSPIVAIDNVMGLRRHAAPIPG
jgi:hypothetical protein